ncbi:cysteine permease [Campylobacter lari]|nr:cysteine permease [Campylobacter lari]EAI7263401.1 cysteine permease [Campylobacter lari]EGK7523422.1 cysteine permease [Campylobacter lari]EGK8076945.1 cysteine permease [Campylobacter lari]EGO0809773.1 cysteine permease [Campylobacter lari]
MTYTILPPNQFLDDYVLNIQLHQLANISKNAYKFWKNVQAARYQGTRVVFLNKKSILKKHQHFIQKCENLSGYVLASAFCSFTTLAPSHLVEKNNSQIYKILDIKEVCGVKFVNLKAFYDLLKLDYNHNIYIEKCHFFSPTPLEKRIKITESMCVGYY